MQGPVGLSGCGRQCGGKFGLIEDRPARTASRVEYDKLRSVRGCVPIPETVIGQPGRPHTSMENEWCDLVGHKLFRARVISGGELSLGIGEVLLCDDRRGSHIACNSQ